MNKKGKKVITETNRLRLRRLEENDADFVFQLVNEPSFIKNIGDKEVRSRADAVQFIRESYWTNQKKEGYGQFLVELKKNSIPIGMCGILYRDSLQASDVGFAFLPEYWGKGYAIEAADAVYKYARSTLGVGKIVGLTNEDNLPSIKILKKLGMKFERIVKMSADDPGTSVYS